MLKEGFQESDEIRKNALHRIEVPWESKALIMFMDIIHHRARKALHKSIDLKLLI